MSEKTETKKSNREVVVPGEVIAKGDDFLPGDWTNKIGEEIVANRLGIVDKQDRLVKVIPISGVYIPRRGNVVIAEVKDISFNGWNLEVGGPYGAFLMLKEIPGFVEENEMESVFGIGDLVVVKILNVKRTSIDLTMKQRERGLMKVNGGMIVRVNPQRVPRVIGKEGSMVGLIRNATKTSITVGQNGLVWIKGDKVEDELMAKNAVDYVVENTISEGLTDKVEKWLREKTGYTGGFQPSRMEDSEY